MPRQPRLDAPGLVHHVIARGIERRDIFRDDRDRAVFTERLGELVCVADAELYAWCLLSNHLHLVLRTGQHPLPWLMRRLLTSHAVRFNRRHGRSGHLFQNRYKSIVVEEEPYLLELVRYIALNPQRAGMVHSADELDRYPWSGHATLVGTREASWQAVDAVLERFAAKRSQAVVRYREFVLAGWDQGRREELVGGGLIRSAGGEDRVLSRQPEEREASDERVLGSGEFVESVWRATDSMGQPVRKRAWREILEEVAAETGIDGAQILGTSRVRSMCRARAQFLCRAKDQAGLSLTELGRLCRMQPSSVSRAVERARGGG